MSLIPRETWPDIFRVFDHDFPTFRNGFADMGTLSPRLDIIEKEDKYEVQVDLPGVDKNDISLSYQNGTLTVEATTSKSNETKDGDKLIHKERYQGKMVRSFTLGEQIRQQDIDATFTDGVLTVMVPKTETKVEAASQIEIH